LLVELDVLEAAAGGELVAVVERALVVVAEYHRDVALGGVDEALEAVELADLRLGGAPEVVGVRGVVRLLADGDGVRALVLVVDEVPDAHDLVATLDHGRRRLERRRAGRRGLEHAPQLGPLPVDVADGDDLDHVAAPPLTSPPLPCRPGAT